MRASVRTLPALLGILATSALSADVNDKKDKRLTADLYFQWEEASDPQISPDASRIVYVRRWPDIMTDRRLSNIWTVNFNGGDNRPLTTGEYSDSSPRWSPDGVADRAHESLRGGGFPIPRDQLVQLCGHRGLRQLDGVALVSKMAVGRCGRSYETLTHRPGGERDHPHSAHYGRSRLADTNIRDRAILPRLEAAEKGSADGACPG